MRKKTRDKLSKTARTRGISPVVRAIQEFEEGTKVHIKIDPSIHKGMPHPRFHGLTGEVVGKRGRAFILNVRVGNAHKTVIALPEHLMLQERLERANIKLFNDYAKVISSAEGKEMGLGITKLFETIIRNR